MGDPKICSFGKRKKTHKRSRKLPASLLRRCKKYHIKTTKKVGKHRVYRKVSVLKKLLRKKLKKVKGKRSHRRSHRRSHKKSHRRSRRSGFGESDFSQPSDYGYNEPVNQYPGTLDQTISTVTAENNMSRPEGFSFDNQSLPAYGVYRDFFGEEVPTQVPPNYNFMGQPDKTLMPVGYPFERFTTPPAFGKRRYRRKGRRYNVTGSNCNRLKKRTCKSNPNCSYTRRGCRRRTGTATKGVVYEGPSLEFGKRRRRRYNVAGSPCNGLNKRVCVSSANCRFTKRGCRRRSKTMVYEGPSLEFGRKRRKTRKVRRRRYNVAGSSCNKLKKRTCQSNPNCSYTRRGCRRRTGTATKGVVYEGPSLEFGKRRRRRYNVAGSPCNGLNKRVCVSSANCRYTKRGCRRRSKTMVYEGPSLEFGRKTRKVRRYRRYNVAGSPCNKLRKRKCVSSANCRYTKRGCRRRSKSMVYEGPSLEFGKRRRRVSRRRKVRRVTRRRVTRRRPVRRYRRRV
jgi:hypothetical protein